MKWFNKYKEENEKLKAEIRRLENIQQQLIDKIDQYQDLRAWKIGEISDLELAELLEFLPEKTYLYSTSLKDLVVREIERRLNSKKKGVSFKDYLKECNGDEDL